MPANPVPPSCPECGRHLDLLDPTLVPAVKVHAAGDRHEHGNGAVRFFHQECFEAVKGSWRRVEPSG